MAISLWILIVSGFGVAIVYCVARLMGVEEIRWTGYVIPLAIVLWASSRDRFGVAIDFWRDLLAVLARAAAMLRGDTNSDR